MTLIETISVSMRTSLVSSARKEVILRVNFRIEGIRLERFAVKTNDEVAGGKRGLSFEAVLCLAYRNTVSYRRITRSIVVDVFLSSFSH